MPWEGELPVDPGKFCEKCIHWDYEGHPIETGKCECSESSRYDQLTYFDSTCEMFLEASNA